MHRIVQRKHDAKVAYGQHGLKRSADHIPHTSKMYCALRRCKPDAPLLEAALHRALQQGFWKGFGNMSGIMTGLIMILVLLLLIMGGVGIAIWRVKSMAQRAFGTSDLREGIRQIEQEYAMTPKSISAMTGLYLPKIKSDFPEFQYDEMKVRAENALTSYLMAVDRMNQGILKEGNRELHDKLEMRIQMLQGAGRREHYKNIKLHRTELCDYKKRDGRCIITFQSAVQYYYTITDENGKIMGGRSDMLTQSRYNTDVIYIQDREKVEDERGLSLGLNCPNCGAPISGTGSKVCEYCGTPVIEVNIHAWTFSNIIEVK
ncbi:zinc ribbon domain-containing protein [Parablautia intestinalis]|uniref:Zinc ribbon domain-containing protein n=2 Tax=Parablautia intestinalis TaxID=2320100 RepID=A0A3A9AD03_9FIRM|nr:zinc ribbon domain-containing protein [Parablautia intestinalis]